MSKSILPQPIDGGSLANVLLTLEGQKWAVQPKWDGWRLFIEKDRIRTRKGRGISLPRILAKNAKGLAEMLGAPIDAEYLIREGKIIIHDAMIPAPYLERREALRLLPPLQGITVTHDFTNGDTYTAYHECKNDEHEGIVLKRLSANYSTKPGPCYDWVKIRFNPFKP